MKVLISKKKLDIITDIARLFKENGYELYLTGGAVRDLLLGKSPSKYELSTNAKPRHIAKILKNYRTHILKNVGIVKLSEELKIITYKHQPISNHEEYSEEKVKYADTLREDLNRRDFTINAIAVDPMWLSDICMLHKHIVDPFNGLKDLRMKIIRFVGTPNEKIFEEPIVIIKAMRYAVHIHGKFHLSTIAAIKRYAPLCVEFIPMKLFKEELYKALITEKPSRFFYLLKDFELLDIYFPSLIRNYGLITMNEKIDVFTHCMLCGNSISPKYPLLRLAGYLHDIGKVEKVWTFHEERSAALTAQDLNRLKFSKTEIKYIFKLIMQHSTFIYQSSTKLHILKTLKELERHKVDWRDWIRLRIANKKSWCGGIPYDRKDIKLLIEKIYEAMDEGKKLPVVVTKKRNKNEVSSFLKTKVLVRDGYECQYCNNLSSILEVHDSTMEGDIELCITVCETCHIKIHEKEGNVIFYKEEKSFPIKNLLINGYDIMDTLDIKPGRRVGNILNKLAKLVDKNKELNNRERLLHLARNL